MARPRRLLAGQLQMLVEFGIERRLDGHFGEHLTKLGEVRFGLNRLRCLLSECL
jgi:hypothetical protein